MPEICGAAALLASPEEPEAWIARIAALLGSDSLRADLAGRGREQVKSFSWTGTAEGYRTLMTDPLAVRRRRAAPETAAPLPRVAVAVATRGRPDVVTETVRLLVETQTHAPVSVVVSCADSADAGGCAAISGVTVIQASPGLAAQRNAALDVLTPGSGGGGLLRRRLRGRPWLVGGRGPQLPRCAPMSSLSRVTCWPTT